METALVWKLMVKSLESEPGMVMHACVPVLERQRRVDQELKANLSYTVSLAWAT